MMVRMIFRQLFEPISCTYTYLLGCETTRSAMLIDPVVIAMERDLCVLAELGLTLRCAIDTHIHADHITAALELKQRVGCLIAAPAVERLACVDVAVEEGVPLAIGEISLRPLHTPGHTEGHFAYALDDRVFTGDALLIDGCGRTDFQNGDATTLYRSVTEKLFTLGDDVLVYPAHDYENRCVSTIGRERVGNARLGGARSLESFVALMSQLNLPYPSFIDYAVPGNRACGVLPQNVPEHLEKYCRQMTETPQG
jgi:glyoxylase-like metal-dependent hydrolase (beta-lactamase superfamily II)